MAKRTLKEQRQLERERKQARREKARKAQDASSISDLTTMPESQDVIEVRVKVPRPEAEEVNMSPKQRRQQNLRKLGQQMADLVASEEKFRVPGFTPYRVTLDKNGQVKSELVEMPAYYQQVLTMCENLVKDASVLPLLAAHCPAMRRADVRKSTGEVLAVLLCSAEFEGGRIGYLQKGAEMDPKAHHQLRKEHLLRFAYEMDEKTWFNGYGRLKHIGYIQDLKVTIPVDLPGEGEEKTTLIRSAASYKQFTPLFFEHFKVTQFPNVKALIQAGVANLKKQGYRFLWASFSILAKGVRDRIQAQFLNELVKDTLPVTGGYTLPIPPIPY